MLNVGSLNPECNCFFFPPARLHGPIWNWLWCTRLREFSSTVSTSISYHFGFIRNFDILYFINNGASSTDRSSAPDGLINIQRNCSFTRLNFLFSNSQKICNSSPFFSDSQKTVTPSVRDHWAKMKSPCGNETAIWLTTGLCYCRQNRSVEFY